MLLLSQGNPTPFLGIGPWTLQSSVWINYHCLLDLSCAIFHMTGYVKNGHDRSISSFRTFKGPYNPLDIPRKSFTNITKILGIQRE